jgi:pyruvate,water dikinase
MKIDVDLLHIDEPNRLLWSRTNFAEAMPGVLTPLSWSFWGPAGEASSRRVYEEKLGAFRRGELTDALADQMTGLFHGRAAVNVDLLRRTIDRVPGADPDALELQILGAVRPDAVSNPTLRRVPAVLCRVPINVMLLPRRVRRLRSDIDAWWRRCTGDDPATVRAAGIRILEAQRRFVDAASEHGFNVFIGQAAYEQVAKLAARVGHPGLELSLAAAGDGTEETAIVDHLWDVVAGTRTLEEVVADHGYHGPDEGQISSWSWREDPSPLVALIDRYETIGAARPPATRATRRDAVAKLNDACTRSQRLQAWAVLRFADRHLPLREVGKAAFLQCLDVARHAAHTAGQLLVEQGRLATVDDVSLLSVEEIVADRFDPAVVERRRARRAELLELDVPDTFVGVPQAEVAAERAPAVSDESVTGVPASPGCHTGVARLVRDAFDYDRVDDGDVLVCELTDPGWAPLLAIVGAAVIDIGGALSHGAIVARELGIPCVIGTGDGTRRIVDGAVVTVDGDTGIVTRVGAA